MIDRFLIAVALLASTGTAYAQQEAYPTRSIKMVVPFAAGGASDTTARIVSQRLSERMGQQFIVENRGGAGGTIGAAAVAKAVPDGYTLLMGSSTEIVTSPHIYKTVPYDTLRDFSPISFIASQPLILVVHPSVPAKSVAELVALAKARPGELNAASAGTGSTLHLAQVLFEKAAQVKLAHIPFNGSPAAATATLGGNTQVNFGTVPAVLELVRTGQLRGLAVTGTKRIDILPELPTLAEAGLPGYEMVIWLGLFGPRGVPAGVISRLNAEVAHVLALADVRETFRKIGTDLAPGSPDSLAKYVAEEWAKMETIIAASGAKIE